MRIACVSQFIPGNQKTVHFYDLSAELAVPELKRTVMKHSGKMLLATAALGAALAAPAFAQASNTRQDAQTSN